MTNKAKGNWALLLTAALWGTGFIAQKLGNEVMPPMAFNAIRQLMAAVVLCPVLAVSLKKSGYLSRETNTADQLLHRKKRILTGGFICGMLLMLGSMTQQIGLVTVSAGKSGFISSIYIVFVPLFSVLLGRRVTGRTFFCVVLAMIGFAFLSLKGGLGNVTAGDWWTLLSAAGFAAQIIAVNQFVDKDNDILLSVLQMAFCGIIGLIIAIAIEHPTGAQITAAMPALIFSTLVPTAGGYTLQIVGEKYADPSTSALIMSLEAVFAAIFGMLFLSERMAGREIIGCVIIFAAIIISQLDRTEEK